MLLAPARCGRVRNLRPCELKKTGYPGPRDFSRHPTLPRSALTKLTTLRSTGHAADVAADPGARPVCRARPSQRMSRPTARLAFSRTQLSMGYATTLRNPRETCVHRTHWHSRHVLMAPAATDRLPDGESCRRANPTGSQRGEANGIDTLVPRKSVASQERVTSPK
jgi:hypothetical protein